MATFTPSGGINNWWAEVYVEANEAVTMVDARVNAGSWVALEKKSWGSWAKSFHIPTGSEVDFRATGTSGAQAVSEVFCWLATTCGAPPPPPPGDFVAAYALSANINRWWVEVYVTSDRAIAAVDARDDGGPWVALEEKSWGSWAKSFLVAAGSVVEFRAHDGGGATHVSSGFVWP